MEAAIAQDYRGIDIIVNAADAEFNMLTIEDLKKCKNTEVEKNGRGWVVVIDKDICNVTRCKTKYGYVLEIG